MQNLVHILLRLFDAPVFLFEVETQFVLMLKMWGENHTKLNFYYHLTPFIHDCIYSDITFIQSAISRTDVHLQISTFPENINLMSQLCTKIYLSIMYDYYHYRSHPLLFPAFGRKHSIILIPTIVYLLY